MVNYIIGDTLIRIKNASAVRKDSTVVLRSNFVIEVLKLLKRTGFIKDFKENEDKRTITVELAYKKNGMPKLANVKFFSKPGRHLYIKYKELTPVRSGKGIQILSTSSGILSNYEAMEKKVGGEIICEIW